MVTEKKRRFRRITALALFLCVLFLHAVTPVTATNVTNPGGTGGGSTTSTEEWSFYKISSAASGYMNRALSPSKSDLDIGCLDNFSLAGNAASVVGYFDPDKTGGILGWISSALSNSSDSISVQAVKDVKGIRAYLYYGNLLNELGLDKSSVDFGKLNVFRSITGNIAYILYLTAQAVPMVFRGATVILGYLNPFRMFAKADNMNLDAMAAEGKTAKAPGISKNFAGLVKASDFLSGIYDAFSNFSWSLVIPMFLVALVLSFFFVRGTSHWPKVKKYLVRVVFLAAGVPICGALYTTSLDAMAEISVVSGSSATSTITSTFCDFENWAKKTRLAPPGDMKYEFCVNTGTGKVNATNYSYLRDTCYRINRSAGVLNGSVGTYNTGTGKDAKSVVNWNRAMAEDFVTLSRAQFTSVTNLLNRYKNGTFYYPGDYEGYIKKQYFSGGDGARAEEMVPKSDDTEDYKADVVADRFTNAGLWDGKNIFADGTLQLKKDSSSNKGKYTASGQGLSSLGMYNYLCTSFKPDGCTIYSSVKASSGLVKYSHYSVNLIGTGMESALYYCNCMLLLLMYVIIGYFYAFSIIIANFKRGIRLMVSIPFSMLGSIRSIAKVISYTVLMIVEMLATMYVYTLVSDLLFSITDIFEAPIAKMIDAGEGGAGIARIATSGAVTVLMLIISCVINLLLIIAAIRLRKSIVKSMEETANAIVNKFFDVDTGVMPDGAGAKGGVLSAVGGAAATGAGMAAGQRLMGGMAGSSASDAKGASESIPGMAKGPDAASDNTPGTVDEEHRISGGGQFSLPDHGGEGSGVSGRNGRGPNGPDTSGGGETKDREIAESLFGADSLSGGSYTEDGTFNPDPADTSSPEKDTGIKNVQAADDLSGKDVSVENTLAKGNVQGGEEAKGHAKEGAKEAAKATAKGVQAYATGDAKAAAEAAGHAAKGVKEVKAAQDARHGKDGTFGTSGKGKDGAGASGKDGVLGREEKTVQKSTQKNVAAASVPKAVTKDGQKGSGNSITNANLHAGGHTSSLMQKNQANASRTSHNNQSVTQKHPSKAVVKQAGTQTQTALAGGANRTAGTPGASDVKAPFAQDRGRTKDATGGRNGSDGLRTAAAMQGRTNLSSPSRGGYSTSRPGANSNFTADSRQRAVSAADAIARKQAGTPRPNAARTPGSSWAKQTAAYSAADYVNQKSNARRKVSPDRKSQVLR